MTWSRQTWLQALSALTLRRFTAKNYFKTVAQLLEMARQ
jgi:hypothetical protein